MKLNEISRPLPLKVKSIDRVLEEISATERARQRDGKAASGSPMKIATDRFSPALPHPTPVVSVISPALASLTQVRIIVAKVASNHHALLTGTDTDVPHALYILHLSDMAVRALWDQEEKAVAKSMGHAELSRYKRAYQRKICEELRTHLTNTAVERITSMTREDRIEMAEKRSLIDSVIV